LDKLESLLSDAERVTDVTRIAVSTKRNFFLKIQNMIIFLASTRGIT
jgi:hypothetical protein